MKNLKLFIISTICTVFTTVAFSQALNESLIKAVIDSAKTYEFRNESLSISSADSQAYYHIISGSRIGMNFNEGTTFTINSIAKLLQLKDALEILPSSRQFKNGFMRDDLGEVTDNPCNRIRAYNVHKTENKLSVNYELDQLSASQVPLGTLPMTAFDVNLINKCNNTRTTAFFVGVDRRIGFGNNSPQAMYHFSNFDMLVGPTNGYNLKLSTENNRPHLVFSNNGDRLFMVNKDGKVFAKEFEVLINIPVPDYVFEESYNLLPLQDVKTFIAVNKHLPGIKSAKEFEAEGTININEMQMALLKKIEELTLYILQMSEQSSAQQQEIEKLKQQLADITGSN
jgi:hypothetical protein